MTSGCIDTRTLLFKTPRQQRRWVALRLFRHRTFFLRGVGMKSRIFLFNRSEPFDSLARFVSLALLLLVVSPITMYAQGLSGVSGSVTDSSGGAVPDARITVTNVATNVSSSAVTTSAGTYVVTDLIPGVYTIKIEKAGFSTGLLREVHVDVSRMTNGDLVLKTGANSETVEVFAEQIALETTQPQEGTVIENKLVDEVPILIGGGPGNIGARDRQIDDYLFLAPGVQGGEFSHRINGGVDFENEVVFNGVVAVQSETQGLQSNINPPFEMISEVQVLTSTFSAQYGLSQGVASYQFASGTNTLHGDAFEIVRNTILDAAGATPPGSSPTGKGPTPTINQNNFGFSLGGPVWIPKIYNGKNKTFFHFSADWFRLNLSDQSTFTVPTPAEVGGDFSGYVDGNGNQIPIFVPQGFVAPAGCTAPAPGQQWVGNKIPTSCFSSISSSLLRFIPTPNLVGSINNATSSVGVLPTRQTNFGFSIDHTLTDKQKLHGSFWRDNYNLTSCCNGGIHVNNELSGLETEPRLGTGLFLTYSNAIRNNLVVTGGFGWLGEINNELNSFLGVNFPGVAGAISLPAIHFNAPFGNQPTQFGLNSNGETFSRNRKLGLSFDNNWLYSHGRHTINFGFEIRRSYQNDQECQRCGGNFTFSSLTTGDPANLQTTGGAFASFLLGEADSAHRQFAIESRLRNIYYAPYVQDDIKVTSRLTVNAGLRWDILRPFEDNNDNVLFFDATAANPGAVAPNGTHLLGAADKLGNCPVCSGYRRANIHWRDFSPRIGFAYKLDNKTVILSGYAINFLDGGAYEYGDNKIAVNYGSLLGGVLNVNSLNSNVPGYGQWDGNPIAQPAQTNFTDRSFLNSTGVLRQFSRDPGKIPYTQSWNAGIQRELPGNLFLSVSYIGNRSLHLPSLLNPINQTDPKFLTRFCGSANPTDPNCPLSPSSPNVAWTSAVSQADLQAAGFSQASVTCGPNTNNPGLSGTFFTPYVNFLCDYGGGQGLAQALLPFPQFNASESCGGICNNFDNNGSAFYNALQVQAQKRFSRGLSFLVAYTLSKTLSNTDTGFSTFNFGSENRLNQKSEYSIAGNDQTHLLSISGVYELPIGPGKKFLGKGGQLAKNILGGWQVTGVFQYSSGTPLTVFSNNNDPFLNGFNRANFDPSVPLNVNYNNYYKGLPVFTTSAFSDPGFAAGNEPRAISQLRNPFNSNENVGLAKHFFFGEHVTAELRIEFFNVLNREQVCGVNQGGSGLDANVNDGPGRFGLVSPNGAGGSSACQANTPRQGQGFFKLSF
jgi:Carboxypeptidase regulatory-like domain